MTVDLTVYLDHRPGQVAAVAEALAGAGVNVEGYFGLVHGDQGIMHVAVEDAAAAAAALDDAGFEVHNEQEVLVIDCEDRPGALAERLAPLTEAGVNLTCSYLATATRLIVAAEDLDGARDVIRGG